MAITDLDRSCMGSNVLEQSGKDISENFKWDFCYSMILDNDLATL